jgi:V/A-type H+-transporting ATPase subunit C
MHWLHEKGPRNFIASLFPEAGPPRGINEYLSLWRKTNVLDKTNRPILRSLLGMEIDLHNIVWMYRLKRYYGVYGDGTYGFLIPVRHRLVPEMTKRMADAKDERRLLSVAAEGPYSRVFPHFERPEQLLYQALAAHYKKEAKAHPHSLAPVCGYLFAKQMEARNLTAVTEGLRYGLTPAEIQTRLVMVTAW